MKTTEKHTSKHVLLGIVLIALILLGLLMYELLRFKPLEPIRDADGEILSTPTNGFRNFETSPTRY